MGSIPSSLVFWLFEKDCYKFCFFSLSLSTYSISLLVISRFKLHISSWFSFGGLYVNISRKLSIYSRLSSLSAGLFVAFSYGGFFFFFNFYYLLLFLLFHFWFCLGPLSFSLGELLDRGLCHLCLSFWKNQVLFFLISFIYFLSCLYYCLPLLTLGFVCFSFSNSFRWWVRLLIWDFSCFLKKICITMNFPLRTVFSSSQRFLYLCVHCHLSQGIFKFSL